MGGKLQAAGVGTGTGDGATPVPRFDTERKMLVSLEVRPEITLFSAPATSAERTCAADIDGFIPRSKAAAPDTCGQAMDVPL